MATPVSVPAALNGPSEPCPNCGSHIVRRYCASCGQARPPPGDYSLGAHAADLVDHVASIDGKAARTAWALLAHPGVLTADHLAGRRVRYLRPLQLFVVVNLLLFAAAPKMPLFSYNLANYLANSPPSPALVSALVERATAKRQAEAAGHRAPSSSASLRDSVARRLYAAAFDGRVEAQRKSLIILFAPALALVLWAMFAWRTSPAGVPSRYGEHLVFALHSMAFVWLVFAVWGGVAAVVNGRTLGSLMSIGVFTLVLVLFLAIPAYMFRAVLRCYRLSWRGAVVVTAALMAAFAGLLLAYRTLLFFTTYYTL